MAKTPLTKKGLGELDPSKLETQKKMGAPGYSIEQKEELLAKIIEQYDNSEYTIESICAAFGTSYDSFYAWLNGNVGISDGENELDYKRFQALWLKAKKARMVKQRLNMVEAGQQYLHQFIQNPILRKKKTLIIKKGKTTEAGEFEPNENEEAWQHTTIEEYEQPNSVLAILNRIDPEGYGGKADGDDGEVVVRFETSPAPVRKEEADDKEALKAKLDEMRGVVKDLGETIKK